MRYVANDVLSGCDYLNRPDYRRDLYVFPTGHSVRLTAYQSSALVVPAVTVSLTGGVQSAQSSTVSI